jgi:hypothetical protein
MREYLYEGPCQNESYLELPDKKEHARLLNKGFFEYQLVINNLVMQSLRVYESLESVYLLGGKFVKSVLLPH